MKVQVSRWGNSLGLRIPKELAGQVGLSEGARVDIEAEGGRLVVSLPRPRFTLEDLVQDMSPDEMRQAFDWGGDKGREAVEE